MARAPTLNDVAHFAGVSYATADRVVNDRGNVAQKSQRRVQDAVAQLGYVRNVAAANLSQRRVYRFGFVLPAGGNAFFDHIRRIVAERTGTAANAQTVVEVFDVPAFDVSALCAQLKALEELGFDGIAVVGLDDPAVSTAIEQLRRRGIAVVTLVSDVKTADNAGDYVGVDNVAAGRTAGRLIGMAHANLPGTVQIVLGSRTLRDHAERLSGANAVLAQDFPALHVLQPLEGRDQDPLVERLLAERLTDVPQVSAIYGLGAGNNGIFRVMAARPADRPRPFCVVHELIPDARRAIEAGLVDAVIDQQPEQEVTRALALLRRAVDRLPPEALPPLTPTIYLRDNLPASPLTP